MCFSSRSYLIFPSCFSTVINHTGRDSCILRVGVCRWIAGQMWTPGGQIFVVCRGAKAQFCLVFFFHFMPSVVCPCVCVCVCNASAAKHHQVEWYASRTDARRVAAAYYHLVRGEDRVVITTSSSANGCVFSPNLYAQVICRVECVSRRRERDKELHHVSVGSDSLGFFPLFRSCRWMSMTSWIWSTRRWC